MLGSNPARSGTRCFRRSDISPGCIVRTDVAEHGHGLPAVVHHFVLDAVPAGGGCGECSGLLTSGWRGKVIDDRSAIDPQPLRLEGLDPEGAGAGLEVDLSGPAIGLVIARSAQVAEGAESGAVFNEAVKEGDRRC